MVYEPPGTFVKVPVILQAPTCTLLLLKRQKVGLVRLADDVIEAVNALQPVSEVCTLALTDGLGLTAHATDALLPQPSLATSITDLLLPIFAVNVSLMFHTVSAAPLTHPYWNPVNIESGVCLPLLSLRFKNSSAVPHVVSEPPDAWIHQSYGKIVTLLV
jgi:hypothetical protein